MKPTRKRHIMKAFSWRVIATVFTMLTTLTITGSIRLGLMVGSIDFIGKIFLYYAHERLWYNKLRFGLE